MDRARDEIAAAGGDAVSVFQYRAEPTRNFCRKRGVSLDCFGDPERDAYSAVGLEEGSMKEYAGLQLVKGFLRAARSGALPGNTGGGAVSQRPGTFVVGRDGKVVMAHYNEDSSDNPSIEAILAAVRQA